MWEDMIACSFTVEGGGGDSPPPILFYGLTASTFSLPTPDMNNNSFIGKGIFCQIYEHKEKLPVYLPNCPLFYITFLQII